MFLRCFLFTVHSISPGVECFEQYVTYSQTVFIVDCSPWTSVDHDWYSEKCMDMKLVISSTMSVFSCAWEVLAACLCAWEVLAACLCAWEVLAACLCAWEVLAACLCAWEVLAACLHGLCAWEVLPESTVQYSRYACDAAAHLLRIIVKVYDAANCLPVAPCCRPPRRRAGK